MTYARTLLAAAIVLGLACGGTAAQAQAGTATSNVRQQQQVALLAKRYGYYADSINALQTLFDTSGQDGCIVYGVRPYSRWTRKDVEKILHPADPRVVRGYGLIGDLAEAAHKAQTGDKNAQNVVKDILGPRLTELFLTYDDKVLHGPQAGPK